MAQNNSIILQVDKSTKQLMAEIENSISGKIINEIMSNNDNASKDDIDGINRKLRGIDEIQDKIENLKINVTGVTETTLQNNLSKTNEQISRTESNIKNNVDEIRTSIKSNADETSKRIDHIKNDVDTIRTSINSNIKSTADETRNQIDNIKNINKINNKE